MGESAGHLVELPSGAKIFVRPEQYSAVMDAMENMDLKPRHIVVSQELEPLVRTVIDGVKRTTIKRRRITTTQPKLCNWKQAEVKVEVRRTFINLKIPTSLLSGTTVSRHAASC